FLVEPLDGIPQSAPVTVDVGGYAGIEMATPPEPNGAYEGAVDDAQTEVQRTLKEIFRQVLGVTRLTLHDSFFDIGGDSLIAAQLMALVSKEFSIEAPARTIYEAPPVADLAALVEARCVGQLKEIHGAQTTHESARVSGRW